VPGLGAAREAALLDAFGSVEDVRQARFEDLITVRGIGPGMASRIHEILSNGRTS
jgi:excinuclease ABC subunit C